MTTAPILADDTLKLGLLMEGAQAHQALAAENLQRLQAHVRDLDTVVRDEIRRTLLDELQAVSSESHAAVQALRRAARFAHTRLLTLGLALVLLATAIAVVAFSWAIPSAAELAALRSQRVGLETAIVRLRQQGAQVEWRRCGDEQRLCVRIDSKAPAFGEQSDYRIARGY